MIQTENLTRRFGDLTAVDGVSFTVPRGELTGFVGGNGAGKTTTMRMIMGLLGIDAGEVRYDGRAITDADRRRIGYMPEERGLYPKQRVLDQLTYLGELAGMTASDSRRAIREHLDRFGLGDRAHERVEKLSLGNQQRIQIVAALMTGPEALILDEPFSGLDPEAVDSMAGLLREHCARGVPVLFSSHQLDLVERLCDRLVVLARGRVVAEGTVQELRSTGVDRYRLTVDHDAGWVRDLRGLQVLDVDGGTALVELGEHRAGGAALDHQSNGFAESRRRLLEEAMTRGQVVELARVVPHLSEIYREVTA